MCGTGRVLPGGQETIPRKPYETYTESLEEGRRVDVEFTEEGTLKKEQEGLDFIRKIIRDYGTVEDQCYNLISSSVYTRHKD